MAGIPTPKWYKKPEKTYPVSGQMHFAWICGDTSADADACKITIVDMGDNTTHYTSIVSRPSGTNIWTANINLANIGLVDQGVYRLSIRGMQGMSQGSVLAWDFTAFDVPVVEVTSPSDGTIVTQLPLTVSWTVDSTPSDVRIRLTDTDNMVVWSTTVDPLLNEYDLPLDLPIEFTVEYNLYVDAYNNGVIGSGSVHGITFYWIQPSSPTISITNDTNYMTASLTVAFGSYGGLVPETSYAIVNRVSADGTYTLGEHLSDGDTLLDRLPPLGEKYTYQVFVVGVNGAVGKYTVDNIIRSNVWALNFRNGIVSLFRFNPQSSVSLKHGGAAYHFAGGGFPVFYPTEDIDMDGTLSFGTLSYQAARILFHRSMENPVVWIRDPFGNRVMAHVSPSVSHGFGNLRNINLDWTAVRPEEEGYV